MIRILSAAALLTGFVATPAPATAANQYRAELASPVSADRFVVRDLVWSCGAGGCLATQSTSRPATDCEALAGRVGPLKSFSVAGRTLSDAELEKCNAKARRAS
jgi:cob(I)alamin adenosyltransferase